MSKSKFKSPDTTLLIFSMIVVAAILTWIVPAGSFEKTTMEVEGVGTREVVIPGSFQYLEEQNRQGIGAVLLAPLAGIEDAVEIIGFVLIVGGAFSVLTRTGAVVATMGKIVRASERSGALELTVIPILMIIFSLAGGTFGMSEEAIPMILITVPLALALGYDSIVGVAIPMVGAGAGFAGAPLNPFTVGIAQGIRPSSLASASSWASWVGSNRATSLPGSSKARVTWWERRSSSGSHAVFW